MNSPTVFVVDDDAAVRDGVSLLLETAGIVHEMFGSGRAFLAACRDDSPGCIILDVRMPGLSGPELQAKLNERGIRLPIIFLTAHGDIPLTVRAMKAGAVDFLTKPVNGAVLLERVQAALDQSVRLHEQASVQESLSRRLENLTERERDVLVLAVAGHPNKEIARLLGISHRTVEIHRARVMHKTGATNLLELARIAESAGLQSGPLVDSER